MKPINFKQAGVIFAKNQPEYMPLPAYKGDDGKVISCWKMGFKERLKIFLTGRIWLTLLTFNNPLQPQRLDVDCPFLRRANR